MTQKPERRIFRKRGVGGKGEREKGESGGGRDGGETAVKTVAGQNERSFALHVAGLCKQLSLYFRLFSLISRRAPDFRTRGCHSQFKF